MRATLAIALLVVGVPPPSQPPVQSGRTAAGLAYDRQGAGQPIVLISGSNVDRRMWSRETERLKTQFTVIRYDLRAHGQSDLPLASHSPVDDLVALLDELGVRRASLVGLSAGSGIALDAAIEAPDRVEKIVLAAPTIGGYAPKTPPPFLDDLRAALQARDYPRASEVLLASALFTVPAESRSLVRSMVTENDRLWTVSPALLKKPAYAAIDKLETVKAPTLVLVGEHDADAAKARADILARRIPGAILTIVPAGGHLLNLTSPEAFDRAVLDFLRGQIRRD